MPSRRNILCLCSLALVNTSSGCSMTREEPENVEVILQNDDTEEWQMTVVVEQDSEEEVFRTEEVIPADDGEDLGEVRIENAFEGTSTEQFTVHVWLKSESAGTFDYEITCQDNNYFNLLVEYQPYSHDSKEPVHYVPHRCAD